MSSDTCLLISIIPNDLFDFPKLYVPFVVSLYKECPEVFKSINLFYYINICNNITKEMLRGLCSMALEITKRGKDEYEGAVVTACGDQINCLRLLHSSEDLRSRVYHGVYRTILVCLIYIYNNIKNSFNVLSLVPKFDDLFIDTYRKLHVNNKIMEEYILYLHPNLEELSKLKLHLANLYNLLLSPSVSKVLKLVDREILHRKYDTLFKKYQHDITQLKDGVVNLCKVVGLLPENDCGIPICGANDYMASALNFQEERSDISYGVNLFKLLYGDENALKPKKNGMRLCGVMQ